MCWANDEGWHPNSLLPDMLADGDISRGPVRVCRAWLAFDAASLVRSRRQEEGARRHFKRRWCRRPFRTALMCVKARGAVALSGESTNDLLVARFATAL